MGSPFDDRGMMTPVRVHYVTGSRADFGLMQRTLAHLARQPALEIGLVVTGQHMLAHYGQTVIDIEAAGLPIRHRIPVALSGFGGAEMGRAMARELTGFLAAWQEDRPDLVLLLGDRGEMLAAALAAVHLGIHVAHLHGGELSGTLDESFRHAISKLAHFHLTASDDAKNRLIRMGEHPERIWTVGAPGLVGITDGIDPDPQFFETKFGIAPAKIHVLSVFHPVVQEASEAGAQVQAVIDLLIRRGCNAVILRPNSDAGGTAIDGVLDRLAADAAFHRRFRVVDHLPRGLYLSALAHADLLVGNSSSGIIESASFGTPCLNIGTRQSGRLRNPNTVNCPEITATALDRCFAAACALTGPFENLYGDGLTDLRLGALLQTLPLEAGVLTKSNTY